MPTPTLSRRQAVAALCVLPIAMPAAAARQGVEIRFVVEREKREPSGEIERRRFENALVVVPGGSTEVDFRDQYRVRLAVTEAAGVATLRLALWDHEDKDAYAGDAQAAVPIDGSVRVTLLRSDNIRYVVTLRAAHREVPGG